MKKSIFILITGLTFGITQSQEIKDAVRYSQENICGTARFKAMSGAFGALGGDLSSLNINPAGSAVFLNNQLTVTLSNYETKNNSNYFGSYISDNNSSLDLNQAGMVFVFKNYDETGEWKKISLGINYENANNFNNSIASFGINPTNSIGHYFLSHANGVPLSELENSYYEDLDSGTQQAFLAYNAYLIDPLTTNADNTIYLSNVAEGGNYYQENSIFSNGYNGKLSFNAAASYENNFYIGLNLNSHFVDYTQSSVFYEDNSNNLDVDYKVNKIQFNNELYTYGSGFSFQIGAIAKPTESVRLGLSYQSPTWYKLYDELSQKLIAVSANLDGTLPADVVDPRITNVYAPYKLQTPGKLTTSFAYIFGKSGLISMDYSYKDYSSTKFKPEYDSHFRGLNNSMSTMLTNTNELRIGGEYKIQRLSLRGGFRYEDSPYKNNSTVGHLNSYSGGLGYNFGSTKADLAYSYGRRNSKQGFFDQGLTDGPSIESITNTVSLTLLFEL